jgi:glyoxylase I family protein
MIPDPKGVAPGRPHGDRTGTINHLRLTVSDIARSKAFYAPLLQRLGYALVEESPSRLAWASWAPHGTLHWLIMSAAHPREPARAHDRYTPGLHHLAWNVASSEEVGACHRMLTEMGAEILDPPAFYDYEPGYYAVFFLDPDGMKLEVVHVDVHGSLAYWQRVVEKA